MFCPQCKAEYRAGFTRCSDCDVTLVDPLPADEQRDVVRLRSYSTDGEAFLAQSVLQSAGLDVMVGPPPEPFVPRGRSFGIGLPSTDVYVHSADFLIANEILSRSGQR